MADFFTVIINGAVQGSVLALLAMGFSLVYGVGGILNLAHGALYTLSGYIIFWFYYFNFPYYSAVILGLIVIMLVAALVYILLIKPIQENEIAVMIITFSLAFFIQQFIINFESTVVGGLTYRTLPTLIQGTVNILGANYSNHYFLTLICALIIIILMILFIYKTKIGKTIRAVSQDREAAMLMGINANGILMISVVISALLAGISAFLYVPTDTLDNGLVWGFLIKSFSVVILGGLGSLYGSVIGAFLITYSRNISLALGTFNPIFYQLSELIPLIVILLMLFIRPRGILGKKEIKLN
jgi:branched-chain amino acid transport system permease protein